MWLLARQDPPRARSLPLFPHPPRAQLSSKSQSGLTGSNDWAPGVGRGRRRQETMYSQVPPTPPRYPQTLGSNEGPRSKMEET